MLAAPAQGRRARRRPRSAPSQLAGGGRRAAAALALAVPALLAGCASTSASDPTRAGLEAAGRNMAANLEAGRYRKACEGFTATSREAISVFPMGGCPGALAFVHGFLAVEGHARLGQLFEKRLRQADRHLSVEGGRALADGSVQAVYEDGYWQFEARKAVLDERHLGLRQDAERAAAQLRREGAGELLQAPHAGSG